MTQKGVNQRATCGSLGGVAGEVCLVGVQRVRGEAWPRAITHTGEVHKRWKDVADCCSRAAATVLRHYTPLGRDSAHPPLGLGSDGVAPGEDMVAWGGGGGSNVGRAVRLEAATTVDGGS